MNCFCARRSQWLTTGHAKRPFRHAKDLPCLRSSRFRQAPDASRLLQSPSVRARIEHLSKIWIAKKVGQKRSENIEIVGARKLVCGLVSAAGLAKISCRSDESGSGAQSLGLWALSEKRIRARLRWKFDDSFNSEGVPQAFELGRPTRSPTLATSLSGVGSLVT